MKNEIEALFLATIILVSMLFGCLPLVSAAYIVDEHYMPPESDDLQPICAMKTESWGSQPGYFYKPNMFIDALKIELLFDVQNFTGDQTGGASWPDGKVDIKDTFFLAKHYGDLEGDANWDYMADVHADGKIDVKDVFAAAKSYGYTGTYPPLNLTGVEVIFDTGNITTPDANGFVTIPQDAINFTIKRNGVAIGAMVTFWGPVEAPIAYSTTFEFTVPPANQSDVGKEVWYNVLAKVYVPPDLARQNFYFVATASERVQNVKLNAYAKAGSGSSVNIDLGILPSGYHLLDFQFVDISGDGSFSFHVANTTGTHAWLTRFRVYVPPYSAIDYGYEVKTTTSFTNYDLYYFMGFADDYICNFKVDSTQWYEWQWDTGREKVYAWSDGFLYPVFNSKQNGLFTIEFTFGEIWDTGLLDFQYVSWEMQKQRIGKPKFHATTSLTPQESYGAQLVIQEAWVYGGSSWRDVSGSETGDPIDYSFVSQKIRIIANGTTNDYHWMDLEYPQEANLDISVGFLKLDPRENDFTDIAIMFNLTSGNLYYSFDEGNETGLQEDHPVTFRPTQIEIWTPPCVEIDTPALVYNDTSDISFVSPNFKVASPFVSSLTTGLIMYAFTATTSALLTGPFGVLVGAFVGSWAGATLDFVSDQTIVRSYEDSGNTTYRKLHSDEFTAHGDNPFSLPNNVTQTLFIRLKAMQRYHCGALKIKIKGTLELLWWYWLGGCGILMPIPLEVETTFILPMFIRD